MRFSCKVHTPMFDFNNKKYIRFLITDTIKQRIEYTQSKIPLQGEKKENPLEGNVLTVKVPFRYRRVMCTFEGVPVQSLKKGDNVDVDILYMGAWNYAEYSGYSWKLSYIKLKSDNVL